VGVANGEWPVGSGQWRPVREWGIATGKQPFTLLPVEVPLPEALRGRGTAAQRHRGTEALRH
jgi:hypothetical protein